MNCTAILLLTTCLQLSAAVHAQRITLDVRDAPLEQVLQKIRQQSGYHIVYREEWMANARHVTANLKNASLQDALDACFRNQPLAYSLVENTIVVKDRPSLKNDLNPRATAPPPIDITGRITDPDGLPLQGVSITLKGTTNGTTTNAEGRFTLSVPAKGVLVISSVGFTSQEITISASSDLNIKMLREDQSLNTVVITALGIKKEKKALTYSVTEVGGESMTKAREINLGNALGGRVAGVNATSSATGPAGSSRVVIRGNGSLNGDNQPLYVVNGIPINNSNQGSSGTYGGIDRGDGLSSINPDDIETISVLKGGTAAALYGSRAANGVILITTKSGIGSKGLGVEYNSTFTAENAVNLTDWQYQYGAGSHGVAPTSKSEAIQNGRMSWGARLDGSQVIQPDGVARPYSPVKNNIRNFYNTGNTFTNTIAVSGGNQNANIRFSASDLNNKGILPGNTLDRKLFNLSANMTIAKQLTVEARAQYSSEVNINRPFTSDFQKNANSGAELIATNVDVRTLKPGYDANGNEVLWSDYIYATNPYFVVNKVQNGDTKNRFLGSFTLRYAITDFLYARARVGIDQFTFSGYNIEPTGLAYNNRGSMTTDQNTTSETNSEALLGFDKKFGRFGVNVIAGGNQQKFKNQTLQLASGFFNVPFQYFIGNGSSQAFTPGYSASAINSLFGSSPMMDISISPSPAATTGSPPYRPRRRT
jgi:TonB-linked SusC/RagA family outer membrane protein